MEISRNEDVIFRAMGGMGHTIGRQFSDVYAAAFSRNLFWSTHFFLINAKMTYSE